MERNVRVIPPSQHMVKANERTKKSRDLRATVGLEDALRTRHFKEVKGACSPLRNDMELHSERIFRFRMK